MNQTITLDDIAGYPEEKKEAQKIIKIFLDYDKLSEKGIMIPKGLILCGKPGVGKTLFAKAIAGESHVAFYEFEVAEGSTENETIDSLKQLFKSAREHTPSIVFIDELDELVSSKDYRSDYSRKVLKILLSEIDGSANSNGIMVIATTNHYDLMPPALFRSGRIDRKIELEDPDFNSRCAILQLYLDKANITNLSVNEIANKIVGFTGADIKNLINESLINCHVNGEGNISMKDIDEMIPTIRFKGIKKSSEQVDDFVVYHEIGHLLAGYFLKDKIGDVTVNRYGNAMGNVQFFERRNWMMLGEGMEMPFKESNEINSKNYKQELGIILAGYAAEKVMLDAISLGSSSDLDKAKIFAISMVEGGFFGLDKISFENNKYSQESLDKAKKVVIESLDFVTDLLNSKKDLINYIAPHLRSNRTLTAKEVQRLLDQYSEKEGK